MENLWNLVLRVRTEAPLVHSITNFVVMNNTANAVLAAGGSPIMAHAHGEVEAMVEICRALVVNIGTLDEYWSRSMLMAARRAVELGRPWVFDPVGAGATPLRDGVAAQILELRPTVIRGNASEIMALAQVNSTATKGVDSTESSLDAMEAARSLSSEFGSVVCVSGPTDVIVAGRSEALVHNGSTLMTRVTGLGCSASAVIGAFVALGGDNQTSQTVMTEVAAASALFAICGEIAAESAAGPGSLQVAILDKLHNITQREFNDRLRYE